MNKLYIRKSDEKSIKKQVDIDKPFNSEELDYVVNSILNIVNSTSFDIEPIINGEEDIDNMKIEIFYPHTNNLLDLRFKLKDTGKFKIAPDILTYIKNLYK